MHLIGSNKVEVVAIEFLAGCFHLEKHWRQFVSSLLARHCVCRLSFRSHCTGMRWQVSNERTNDASPPATVLFSGGASCWCSRPFVLRFSSFALPFIGALIVTNGKRLAGSMASQWSPLQTLLTVLGHFLGANQMPLSPVLSGACLCV